jgi:LPPG:FO 2-phospho-L-lactate transferase
MKMVALAGGVGGAKLVDGLAQILPAKDLTVIVNTGDDFQYLGLHISPDLDTVCYTLAGIANPETGWGRAGETWQTQEGIKQLGGPGWFRLGDKDLATHLERTRRLENGEPLSAITADFCQAWGVDVPVYPMSDQPVPTQVRTRQGEIPFQEYFVHQRCEPEVTGFRFPGAEDASPVPEALEALQKADLVVICPSNPWVSIEPILRVSVLREVVVAKPVIAVSPLIGGKAVKGPAAKMYRELGLEPSALAVARHYQDVAEGIVIAEEDRIQKADIAALNMEVFITDILMKSRQDRSRFAGEVFEFGRLLYRGG